MRPHPGPNRHPPTGTRRSVAACLSARRAIRPSRHKTCRRKRDRSSSLPLCWLGIGRPAGGRPSRPKRPSLLRQSLRRPARLR
ncbi:hypothetical protein G6F22_016726 [Rhizopus arrhizus]|nr:hypothetical protein G6F22_016726 [Rhizopus arrhizus]KAG1190511.1 hypothetical protein G6F35_013919 [Rhizopus arrhizus]KAG1248948.1 hypothetical protein G6F65_019337 [Rhizopus arrhizus]